MDEQNIVAVEPTIPFDILADLLTRFLIFIPPEGKENLIRICFQIELAHWFYLDYYVKGDKRKWCNIYEFAANIFQQLPLLQPYCNNVNNIINEWKAYKRTIPTYGAILLSEDLSHVLLVESYAPKAEWSFPKGKVNQEEDPKHCAIREVLEETGFDITSYIDPELYLESIIHEQLIRLYIVTDISFNTTFKPQTRFEVKSYRWFAVNSLPRSRNDSRPKFKIGMSANSFFLVSPFIRRLESFCRSKNQERNQFIPWNIMESENSAQYNALIEQNKQIFKDSEPQPLNDDVQFSAPSWLNFKFDIMAIMECFDY